MTENNGFNGPDDRDEEETQILENPIIVSRVRQDLQKTLDGPEGGFRSRRASIMQQIRSEAAQNRTAAPAPIPVVDPGEATQRFTLPINREPLRDTPPESEATQRFTLPPKDATQRFEVPPMPEEAATQRFNIVPPVMPPAPAPAPESAPAQPDNATRPFDLSQSQQPQPPAGLYSDEGATQQFKLPQAQEQIPPPPAVDPRFTRPQAQPPQVDARFTQPQPRPFQGPAQGHEPTQGMPYQPFSQATGPVEPERHFPEASPPIRGIIGQNPVIPPPTPISVRPRKTGQRISGWMGALAAALVLLVVAGAVVMYFANSNKNPGTPEAFNSAATTPAPSLLSTAAPAATKAAATTAAAAPAAGSAVQQTTAAATTAAATVAAATTAADSSSTGLAASETTAAATTAAATTAAGTTAVAATTAASAATAPASSSQPNFGSVTPAPAVSTGPVAAARATGLPQYPNSTPIASLGSGRPIKFILKNDAAAALPNAADRPARGLDDATIDRYNFSGYKVSGLVGDDVVKFYQDQASAAGYKVESVTDLVKDNGSGNKMRWIYLSKGADHVAILVVDAADAESGSAFSLNGNETGIYFCTT